MRREKMSGRCKVIIKNQLNKLRLSVSKGPKGRDPVVIMPKSKKQFLLFPTFPDDKLIVKIKGKASGKYWIQASDGILTEPFNNDSSPNKPGDGPSWKLKINPSYFKLHPPPPDQSVTIGEDEPPKKPEKPPHKKMS
jgi:hypothetical protein